MLKFLDGAIGTEIWNRDDRHLPVWQYNTLSPSVVESVARDYVMAGSNMILTNTFSANRIEVERAGLSVASTITAGIEIAKSAVSGTETDIALDIGPLTVLLEPYGDLTESEAESIYKEMIEIGVGMGIKNVFLETFIDLEMLSIAVKVAKQYDMRVFASMTFDKSGHTLMGNTVGQVAERLNALDVYAMGINCSPVAVDAIKIARMFRQATDKPIILKPNAGLPEIVDGKPVSPYTAEQFAQELELARDMQPIYVGACCGSNPKFISALREKLLNG